MVLNTKKLLKTLVCAVAEQREVVQWKSNPKPIFEQLQAAPMLAAVLKSPLDST